MTQNDRPSFHAVKGSTRMSASFVQQDGRRGWRYSAETPWAVGLKGWLCIGEDVTTAHEEFVREFRSLLGSPEFSVRLDWKSS